MSTLIGTRILGTGLAAAVRGFGVLSPLAFLLRCLPLLCQSPLSSLLSTPRYNEAGTCRHFPPYFVWSVCCYPSLWNGLIAHCHLLRYDLDNHHHYHVSRAASQSPVDLCLPRLCCLYHTLVWGGPSSSSDVQYLPLCASCSQVSHLQCEQQAYLKGHPQNDLQAADLNCL